MRPLPSNLATASLLPEGNAGLWYDKFCDAWTRDWSLSAEGRENPKLKWIRSVTGSNLGKPTLLEEAKARTLDLIHARKGCFGIFTTESRFVTGLGRSHPVENGFAWHPTLGVPYLAGSSSKGLTKAWVRESASAERTDGLFGSKDGAGRVVFMDALPVAPVRLEADVMTPHYAGWSPEDPPGDWL